MFDVIIKNARVVDGTGTPWFRADVALADGKILAVGQLAAQKAQRIIDAQDRVLCPGFIEIHGHSDATLLINPRAESSIHQGVTTECTGNCGYSLFPVTDQNREMVGNQFTAFVSDFDISWSSLGELQAIYANQGIAVNIVPLVGHNTVRAAVKGPSMAAPSAGELKEMSRYIAEAMCQGARGLSTGLEYPPGSAARTEELISLSRTVAQYSGLYVSHIRNRDVLYLINTDCVGVGELLTIHTGQGIVRRHPTHGETVQRLECIAANLSIKTIRTWGSILSGGSSDHAEWVDRGYVHAISLLRGNYYAPSLPGRIFAALLRLPDANSIRLDHIHSSDDTLEGIKPPVLEQTTDVAEAYIREIDEKEQGLKSSSEAEKRPQALGQGH